MPREAPVTRAIREARGSVIDGLMLRRAFPKFESYHVAVGWVELFRETHQPRVPVMMGFATGSGHRPDPIALPILRIGFLETPDQSHASANLKDSESCWEPRTHGSPAGRTVARLNGGPQRPVAEP